MWIGKRETEIILKYLQKPALDYHSKTNRDIQVYQTIIFEIIKRQSYIKYYEHAVIFKNALEDFKILLFLK